MEKNLNGGYYTMYDENKIGMQFLTLYDGLQEILAIVDTKIGKRYVTNDPNRGNNRIYGSLYTDEEMDELLNKQDYFKAKEEERQKKARENAERERKEAEALAKERDLYGFTDGKTQIQKARITDILMKRYNYDGKIITRKQHIIDNIKQGATVDRKENVISYYGSKWNRKESKPKTEYRFYYNDNTYAIITKTEYDFALYMMSRV